MHQLPESRLVLLQPTHLSRLVLSQHKCTILFPNSDRVQIPPLPMGERRAMPWLLVGLLKTMELVLMLHMSAHHIFQAQQQMALGQGVSGAL